MRYVLALVVACAFLGGGSLAVTQVMAQLGQFPFVVTREGQMLGFVEGGVASFKGLAYASPPVGRLRWRPPQPAPASSEMRTAYDYGPACLQPAVSYASEDCLTLNVFRSFDADGPLPVMVFIHGGSFIRGGASDRLFDGARLARAGVIVVTPNYRLGAFGWLANPAHAEGASDGVAANYGLTDQIAALRWVHDNIAAFGGDPNNVTLFGSGAGAISVALLMLCEQARGLFHKAILQSVAARQRLPSLRMAQAVGLQLFEAIGPDGTGLDPRAVDAKLLLAAENLLLARSSRSFGPTADGIVVTDDIAAGFGAGRESRIPLIIGSNEDETSFDSEPDLGEELAAAGGSADELRKLHPDFSGRPASLAARLYTDRVFTEPVRLLARLHAATGSPTFRYRFAYVSEAQRSGSEGGHGGELQFIFGAEGVPGAGVFTHGDREVANRLRTYWTNFAKTGDPNETGDPNATSDPSEPTLPHWDASSDRERLLLISNDGISSGEDPWWNRLDRIERRNSKR